jgi:hypothetical protein
MQLANGAALIAHALDVGLISAILKSGARLRRLPAPFQDNMGQKLFRVLHQYLPYRSFLRSVSRALGKVDRLNISEENAGPLWDSWTQFRSAATARLMIKEKFDQTRLSESMTGCMNKKVKWISTLSPPVLMFVWPIVPPQGFRCPRIYAVFVVSFVCLLFSNVPKGGLARSSIVLQGNTARASW